MARRNTLAQLKRQLLADQKDGKQYTFLVLDGREGVLKPQSLAPEYIKRMTMADVRRLIVR